MDKHEKLLTNLLIDLTQDKGLVPLLAQKKSFVDAVLQMQHLFMKEKANEHRPQVSLMGAVMERKTIEEMDSAEWIAYRREKLDAYLASGKELTPDPECPYCDIHNDYVCFYCEVDKVGDD